MLKPYIFFLLVVLNIDCLPQLTPVPDEYVYYREVRAQLYPIFKPNQQEKEYIKKMIKHIPKELQLFFDSIEYRRQDYINHATKFFQDTTPNIIYEPTNPTESPLCTQSKNLSSGEHNGYVRSEVIDQGNLTFSYKLKKRNGEKEKEKMVLKVLGLAGDFIMHSNAYYALNHILPEIKFYGVMKSIRDPSYRFLKEPPIYDSLSCYCVITEFIDGKSLDDKMLRVVSKWSLKQKLRLIITLMKQLQALQFSYNNYNIFPNKEYGERHTMTLHHGNVRPSNIILANSNNEARFINVGGEASKVFKDFGYTVVLAYNLARIRMSNFSENEKKRHIVFKHLYLHQLQSYDFCRMMTFVLAISLDWKTDDNMEKQKCENMTPYFMKQKLFNGVPINYIRNFYKVIGKTDLWSIFPMLFYLSRPFRTYEESWYPFYLFLYKRIHTEIKHAGVIEEKDQILKKSPEPIPEFPIRFEQDSADEPIEFTTLGNVLESEKTDMKEKSLEERELKFPDFTNLNLDDRIFSEKDDAAPEALRVSIMQAMQTSVIHPRNIKRKEKKKPDIEEEELIEKEEWEEV